MRKPRFYTRLEQARGPSPSRQVLAALARALRLTTDERDHLFRLAGEPAPEPQAPPATSAQGCCTCWTGWPTAPRWS